MFRRKIVFGNHPHPHNEIVGEYIGFTPSVSDSVCPAVCLSIRPTSPVCSVAPTVLVESISYLYI